MSAQLTCDPIIKITLTSNEVFDEVAPGYVCDSFKLTKGLLEPNKFEFTLRKDSLMVEPPDITFELRDKLLAAKVEVNLKSQREEAGEMKDYEVEDFFYGFIQNIKVYRTNGGAVKFTCTAYSPDAKMKHHPASRTFVDCNLGTILAVVTTMNVIEPMIHFDKKEGRYSGNSSDDCLKTELEFAQDASNCNYMPYTVQYNESPYNFLKRLARRHGEFMYYENRTFYFGAMKELPELHLQTGLDLEDYTYEMNMNDHTGITFVKYDTFNGMLKAHGYQKKEQNNGSLDIYKSVVDDDASQNDMAKSAYETAADYFGDRYNSIYELGSQPLFDIDLEKADESNQNKFWFEYQRQFLDRYVMSDSLTCQGKADRLDLKLGSIIVIEDKTKTGAKVEEKVVHKPLKVIALEYEWDSEKDGSEVKNHFKAIPQDAKVPPYLERDKDGFLVYGDFDLYPKCGPQYGIVVDNRDPEHLGRVKVALTWQCSFHGVTESDNSQPWSILHDEDNRTPWIWMLSPYQGFDHGSLAIPEIGDMVLVGFEHNNAERPYVMGSRYSLNDPVNPEWSQFEKNNVKGFRSRSGHTIEFIDADGDAKDEKPYQVGGKIHIYDAKTHAYDITFSTNNGSIRMNASGNIELNAGKNVVINAANDIVVTAGNDMETMVANDKKTTVENNQLDRIQGSRISNINGSGQDFIQEFYVMAVNTDDNGEKGSRLLLNDEQCCLKYIDSASGKESTLFLSTEDSQLTTNIEGCNMGVFSIAGATVVASDRDKVIISAKQDAEINSDMSVKVNANIETVINGQIVKIN